MNQWNWWEGIQQTTHAREQEGVGQEAPTEPTCRAEPLAFSVLLGGKHVHLGSPPFLEDGIDYIWVKGPLVVRGEEPTEVICQHILASRQVRCLKVDGMSDTKVPQFEGLLIQN